MSEIKNFGGEKQEQETFTFDIDRYLESTVNNHEVEENSPSLLLSNKAKADLIEFIGELKKKSEDKKVVVVVRCWGKSQEDLQKFIEKLEKMKVDLPELGAVILSVNVEGDEKVQVSKEGFAGTIFNVERLLENRKNPITLRVIPVGVSGYTWTSGLNGPSALVNNICEGEGVSIENILIFNQSFGVEFSSSEAQKIHESINVGKPVISERADLKDEALDVDSKKKLVDNIIEKIRSNDVVDVSDILPILARNTGMIFSLADIAEIGGFNPVTNSMGGMEDHEFEARRIVYNLRKYNELKDSEPKEAGKCARKVIEILKVLKKQDFVLYNDVDWQPKVGESGEVSKTRRKTKLSTEIGADTKIANDLLAQTFSSDDTSEAAILGSEQRDFNFVR